MSKEFNSPKLDKIMQLGILTKDIEKTIKCYEENFGIGPWTEVGTMSGKNFELYVNGERFTGDFFKVSFLHRYGFEIELIQPLDDSPLKRWVDEHGSGLHHVDFRLVGEEYTEFLENVAKMKGEDTWLRGLGFGGRMDFSYLDLTEELGMYVEVKPNATDHDGNPRPGYEY